MLSDALFEALQQIAYYQREFPQCYDAIRGQIESVKRAMRLLQWSLDVPPGITVCVLDTDLSGWNWSENPVIPLAPDVSDATLHDLIFRWFAPVRASGKGVTILFDVDINDCPGTDIHDRFDVVSLCKRLVSSGFLALMQPDLQHFGWTGATVWAVANGEFDPNNRTEPKGYRADFENALQRCRELIENGKSRKVAPLVG